MESPRKGIRKISFERIHMVNDVSAKDASNRQHLGSVFFFFRFGAESIWPLRAWSLFPAGETLFPGGLHCVLDSFPAPN
jgi:hypothetical protein